MKEINYSTESEGQNWAEPYCESIESEQLVRNNLLIGFYTSCLKDFLDP